MSVEAMAAAFKTRFSNPSARLVLFCLADHHNRSTGLCCPKIKTIMDDTCLSRATVFRALEWLEGIPDPENPDKTVSPAKLIKRDPASDKNGRRTSSEFVLLFLQALGSQSETPQSQSETEEGLTRETEDGLNRETPLKRTGRTNRKNEHPLTPKGECAQGKARQGKAQSSLTATPEAAAVQEERPADTSNFFCVAATDTSHKPKHNLKKSGTWNESFAVFANGYKAICVKAGKPGTVMGKDKGEKAWLKLADEERAERTAALHAYAEKLSREEYLHPQHVSTFISSGWRDFATEPVDAATAAVELENKQVRDVALDLANGDPKYIKAHGWHSFEDVKRKASKIWNAAIEHARREYEWQPSKLAA
ncbi:MAG: helix-turn-helix domain-containing protein [Rhodomicrobium sp.]